MEFFNFKGHNFTILTDRKGTPWWVAKEVCDLLELKNSRQATMALPNDCKKKMKIPAASGRGTKSD